MTAENSLVTTTIKAGADLSGQASLHKAIAVNGTIAADNSGAIGLLKSLTSSGYNATVAYYGEMKCVVGSGGLSAGDKVAVVTSGFIAKAPVSTNPIGKALEAVNSGDTARVIADFTSGLWT